MWILAAVLSSVFAGLTAILSKCGIKNTNSNVATAVRTCVVFVFAWLIVIAKKECKLVKEITKKDLLFLVLSGFATCASWLFYYYAI